MCRVFTMSGVGCRLVKSVVCRHYTNGLKEQGKNLNVNVGKALLASTMPSPRCARSVEADKDSAAT